MLLPRDEHFDSVTCVILIDLFALDIMVLMVCRSAAIFTGGFTVASVLGCAIAGALHYAVESGNNIGIGFAIGVGIFAISIVAAFLTRSGEAKEGGFMDWAKIVCFAGSRNLRSTFKHNPKRWETIAHILTFDCMIKYVRTRPSFHSALAAMYMCARFVCVCSCALSLYVLAARASTLLRGCCASPGW